MRIPFGRRRGYMTHHNQQMTWLLEGLEAEVRRFLDVLGKQQVGMQLTH
jgi:hypothetical protein